MMFYMAPSGSLALPVGSSGTITVQVDGQDGQDVQAPTPTNRVVTISGSGGSHSASVTYGSSS
jgi:hypothetical protein